MIAINAATASAKNKQPNTSSVVSRTGCAAGCEAASTKVMFILLLSPYTYNIMKLPPWRAVHLETLSKDCSQY